MDNVCSVGGANVGIVAVGLSIDIGVVDVGLIITEIWVYFSKKK